jgi:hypothetical protein
MTTMNNFLNIHPSLGQILFDCFQAPYRTHICFPKFTCPLIFNDQFGLSTIKIQMYIPLYPIWIIIYNVLINIYPFLFASRRKTDDLFYLVLPIFIFHLCGKVGILTSISVRWLQINLIKQLVNELISIVSQKSTRGIIFPWNGKYFILEVDMKNSENIPMYDDIDCRNLAGCQVILYSYIPIFLHFSRFCYISYICLKFPILHSKILYFFSQLWEKRLILSFRVEISYKHDK